MGEVGRYRRKGRALPPGAPENEMRMGSPWQSRNVNQRLHHSPPIRAVPPAVEPCLWEHTALPNHR